MAENNYTNIQIYKKKRTLNIGVILFGVIFIYLIITILTYVTGRRVSVYEVREGSILKDTAYTGIVLRQEELITADSDGYINYFTTEGSKVGSKTNVYSLSQDKLDLDSSESESAVSETDTELTAEEQASLIQKTRSFTESYRPEQYRKNNDEMSAAVSFNEAQETSNDEAQAPEAGSGFFNGLFR